MQGRSQVARSKTLHIFMLKKTGWWWRQIVSDVTKQSYNISNLKEFQKFDLLVDWLQIEKQIKY